MKAAVDIIAHINFIGNFCGGDRRQKALLGRRRRTGSRLTQIKPDDFLVLDVSGLIYGLVFQPIVRFGCKTRALIAPIIK